jgi:hypothetical protein
MRSVPYPNLAYLMQGYFHQDWIVDDPDSAAVVERFLEDSEERVQEVATELEAVLRLADADLERLISEELKPDYLPAAGGETTRQWLEGIYRQLSPPRRA